MIYVGTDIVPISRIDKMIQEKGDHFLRHIFSTTEQNICNKKASPSIHYSGKFAAKEAVKKAILSSKSVLTIPLSSIEIQNDKDGMPLVQVQGKEFDFKHMKVSISHAGDYAIATAILELK